MSATLWLTICQASFPLFFEVGVVNKNISTDPTTHQTQLSVCLYNPYFKQVESKTFFCCKICRSLCFAINYSVVFANCSVFFLSKCDNFLTIIICVDDIYLSDCNWGWWFFRLRLGHRNRKEEPSHDECAWQRGSHLFGIWQRLETLVYWGLQRLRESKLLFS